MYAMFSDLFAMNGPYARFMNWLWNILVVSVLWVLCCIPVFTIGPATTAAYYTMAKSVRRHNGAVASEFFSAFRSNFRQAAVFTLIFGLVLGILFLECVYLYSVPEVPLWFLYIFYFMILTAVAVTLYAWPCLSRFHLRNFELFRMAAILTFRHLTTTILLLLLLGAMCVGIYLMPWGILVFPGFMLWLQSFLMEKILMIYAPKKDEVKPDQQKWYYQ